LPLIYPPRGINQGGKTDPIPHVKLFANSSFRPRLSQKRVRPDSGNSEHYGDDGCNRNRIKPLNGLQVPDTVVIIQINLFVFDGSPEPFDEGIVQNTSPTDSKIMGEADGF
jgi:hypothetical protein